MLKRWLSVGLVVSSLLVGCNSLGTPDGVKIAVALPLRSEGGQDLLNAAQLALDEAGSQAGGRAVTLVSFDTSDPEGNPSADLELQAAEQVSVDLSVVAYLGSMTNEQAKVALPVLNRASVVHLSPSATWPGLTKPGFWPGEPGIYYPTGYRSFFRLALSDEVQGAAAARWAKMLGVKSVYVVDDGTAYGKGIAGIFEVTFRDMEGGVLAHDTFEAVPATEGQLTAIATRIVEQQPDLVFLGSSLDGGGEEFLRVFRGVDQKTLLMVPNAMAQDELFADVGVGLTEGTYATNVFLPVEQRQSARAFLQAYQTAYGREPSAAALNIYEAMKVLLTVIGQAEQPTREGVLAAMRNLGEFSGALGTWSFTSEGDISLTGIGGLVAHEGVWEFVQVLK